MALAGTYNAQSIVITDDGNGIAPALANQLKTQGITATVVSTVPKDADMVIFLGGLKSVTDIDSALAINREAFATAKVIAPAFSQRGGVFISVQNTGGDFGLSGRDELQAWTGGLPGLVKTAAQEWPKASLKAIDLDCAGQNADSIAQILATEILWGGAEREVGLAADGTRITLKLVVEPPQTQTTANLPANPVIIAAGGARGVTATTLIAFAQSCQARLALLGRSKFDADLVQQYQALADNQIQAAVLQQAKASGEKLTPKTLKQQVNRILANREIAATLQAIAAAGGEARYLAVDVQDKAAVSAAVDGIRNEWGQIDGIVHGAGVLADAWIENKTVEQFEHVFTTKIEGLRALLAATANDDIQLLAMFSSVAARAGNTGQCDYSMANEILNKVANAKAHNKPQSIVKSFNWGPWEGGMVTPELKAMFEQRGIALIPLQEGADLFVSEMQSQPGQDVEIVVGGESLQSPDAYQSMALQIKLDQSSYPYLLNHQVNGRPVLPMVIALEWFIRVTKTLHPEWTQVACHELQVRKGVFLDDLAQGQWFTINAKQATNGSAPGVLLELQHPDGTVHYTAQARPATAPQPTLPAIDTLQLQPSPWPTVYDKTTLFHGPDFQVIDQLQGVSEQGIATTLKGTATIGWPGNSWQTDPAALDGGLQAAILWGLHVMGNQTLPMKVGEFIQFETGAPSGELQCTLHGLRFNAQRTVSDILISQAGKPIAELRGVEMYAIPGESK